MTSPSDTILRQHLGPTESEVYPRHDKSSSQFVSNLFILRLQKLIYLLAGKVAAEYYKPYNIFTSR
jgi:hypothetical protein